MAVSGAVVVGVVLGVLLLCVLRTRKRAGAPVTTANPAPRPWAGPSRLNGTPALRLPRQVPTPVQHLEVLAPSWCLYCDNPRVRCACDAYDDGGKAA